MKVLVLGATGMLGHAQLAALLEAPGFEARGTVRAPDSLRRLPAALRAAAVVAGDLERPDALPTLLEAERPAVVINCTSLPKADLQDPAKAYAFYGVLPRRLAHLCRERGIRLVQVGSDGVFSGSRGHYGERDLPDATDVYGTAKLLGEVDGPGAVTIRTSIVGPELGTRAGLLEWFLAQSGPVRAFDRAMWSGLPTIVLARLVRDAILPRPALQGIYHVASAPVSKYALLRHIAAAWGREVEWIVDSSVAIDRTLDASRFRDATGWVAPAWAELVNIMHTHHRLSSGA